MKLITLNVWGGRLRDSLLDFVKKESVDTDIFCFQDLLFGEREQFTEKEKGRENIFREIEEALPDFKAIVYRDPIESYFASEFLPLDIGCGQAIFVRNNLNVSETGGSRSHKGVRYHPEDTQMVSGRIQWIKIGDLTVLNLHGMWQQGSKKLDTPERLEQSNKIRQFIDSLTGSKIICGDFNLAQDSQSMGLLEKGMRNLIKEYGITSTRNAHYPKPEKSADYVIVSPEIEVKEFGVFDNEVSDHLPLYLEFN